MPLTVVVQDEFGNQVAGGFALPTQLLWSPLPRPLSLLSFVDPYGDTYFNRLQVPVLRKELHDLRLSGKQDSERQLLSELETLCDICEEQAHHYLKFLGD